MLIAIEKTVVEGAGAAGLACRFQDHDNFYAFVARGDETLAIVKVQGGRSTFFCPKCQR